MIILYHPSCYQHPKPLAWSRNNIYSQWTVGMMLSIFLDCQWLFSFSKFVRKNHGNLIAGFLENFYLRNTAMRECLLLPQVDLFLLVCLSCIIRFTLFVAFNLLFLSLASYSITFYFHDVLFLASRTLLDRCLINMRILSFWQYIANPLKISYLMNKESLIIYIIIQIT